MRCEFSYPQTGAQEVRNRLLGSVQQQVGSTDVEEVEPCRRWCGTR